MLAADGPDRGLLLVEKAHWNEFSYLDDDRFLDEWYDRWLKFIAGFNGVTAGSYIVSPHEGYALTLAGPGPGRATGLSEEGGEAGAERLGAAMRRMAHRRLAQYRLGDASDCDHAAAARDTREEGGRGFHLAARRAPVGRRTTGLVRMCRHHVPEQDVVLEPEVGEHTVDDGGRRLRGPRPRQLPLGRERDPADTGAAVAGRLAHEQDRGIAPRLEVRL